VHWTSAGLLAIFDGDRGAVFTVIVVALLVAGVVVLIVNLSARPRAPAPPAWEAVADDGTVQTPPEGIPAGRPKAAPRRRI
jgi:hypothetical protein